MALTDVIDNYPGYEEGIDGFTLGEKMQQQAQRFGAKTEYAQVERADLTASPKVLHTSEGDFYARTVALATGADPRQLGLENEAALTGRGVAYCAACDGMRYKGKTVVVVGGGNSAAEDALLLSRIARKVVLVHRRDTLRATKIYHEPLMKAENVEFQWNSVVTALLHEDRLTGVRIRNVKTGEEKDIAADGIFISVGRIPATELVAQQLKGSDSALRVERAYPAKLRGNPQCEKLAVIGIQKVKLEPWGCRTFTAGRRCRWAGRRRCGSRSRSAAKAARTAWKLWERCAQGMLFSQQLKLSQIECGEAAWNKDWGGVVLPVLLCLSFVVSGSDEQQPGTRLEGNQGNQERSGSMTKTYRAYCLCFPKRPVISSRSPATNGRFRPASWLKKRLHTVFGAKWPTR